LTDILNALESKVIESVDISSIAASSLPNMVRALNAARLPLREQTLLAAGGGGGGRTWRAVDMSLKLGLDFSSAGPEFSAQRNAFVQELKRDLAYASGLDASHFNVTRLSPGSVIIDTEIHAGPQGRYQDMEMVAKDLERQVYDPRSPLRAGAITRHILGVTLPSLQPLDVLPLEVPFVASTLGGVGNCKVYTMRLSHSKMRRYGGQKQHWRSQFHKLLTMEARLL